jgi:glucuronosyltransferase
MTNAEHGVIIFTMGFNFDTAVVPPERIAAILNAFSRLPQRIVMKLDSSVPSSVSIPTNVLVKSFVPQQEVLSHPKTVLFFTHCGMHGVMEAIWNGVPMVGMPVFIDQGDVMAKMEEKGIGRGLSKWASEEEIYDVIVHVRDEKRQVEYNASVRFTNMSRLLF